MDTTGRVFVNNMTSVKNNPKLPSKIPISYNVGMYIPQLDGRKSLCKDVTTITNLSNHIPTFTKITITIIIGTDLLNFLIQKN
jgi:hypothetical protein